MMQPHEWIQQLGVQAPFASNRVSSLADAQVNVASIHGSAYNQLMAIADEARRRARGGSGVMLWGDPGVGKSHLLARFAQQIQSENQGLFLLIHNLLVAPRLLPLSLLKSLVARLTACQDDDPTTSILYRFLYRLVVETIFRQEGRLPESFPEERARRLFLDHVTHTIQTALPDQLSPDGRRAAEVLFAYFVAAYRSHRAALDDPRQSRYRSAVAATSRWLSGDELEPAQWRALGLTPSATAGQEVFEPNDQLLEAIILVLLEVARLAGVLVVICFDQVENLSNERFVELFRFCHALLDHGRNLLVITSGVRSDLLALRAQHLAPEAAWDRLAADTIDLYFVKINEARQLLQARLEPVVASGRSMADVADALSRDDLFPLGDKWWQTRVAGLIEARPRDVISWAHQRWREQCQAMQLNWEAFLLGGDSENSSSPAVIGPEQRQQWIDERVEKKVRETEAEILADPSRLPPDAAILAGLFRVTLERCGPPLGMRLVEIPSPRTGQPAYDVMVQCDQADGPGTRIGIAVSVTTHATSAAATYRRLAHDENPPDVVIVLRDRRIPEHLGAAGLDYRERLEARPNHFRVVDLDLSELARWSALESVLADARGGDLEVDLPGKGLERIGVEQAVASHLRCDRYQTLPLVELVLGLAKVSPLEPTGKPR